MVRIRQRKRWSIRFGIVNQCLSLLILLLSSFCFGDQDIQITSTTPIRTIARNVSWAGSGASGFNNSYIFTPNPVFTGTCFTVQNNDSSNHSFGIGVLGTADPSVNTYVGNVAPWNAQPRVAVQSFSVLEPPAVTANGVMSFFVSTSGYAKIVVILSSGSGSGTVSIFSVDQNGNEPCVGGPINTQGALGDVATSNTIMQCGHSATISVAVATTSQIVTSTSTSSKVVVCSYVIAVNGVITTPGSIQFLSGTGATCGTGTVTEWSDFVAAALGSHSQMGSGLGVIFRADVDQLCVKNNGATAGSVLVSIAYDYI